jgi:hypothetical protein
MMREFFISVGVAYAVVFAGTWTLINVFGAPGDAGVNTWVKAYFDFARVPLFSGFLTVGSFMVTLQTAILQRLKDAYDNPKYLERYICLKAYNPKARYYGSLERLSLALSFCIVSAFLTAMFQMTFGFIKIPWASALSVSAAAVSLSLVGFLTIQILIAHREWFSKIEEDKQRDLKNAAAKKTGEV